ncbi:antibiotic biosynthesis monooxygenase family protein [Rhizobium sp. NZLR1b]|uniref:antibiotic biosynthesis monooxygenase family protein n=1 Tax=Rhizobium sp. NZLR1b TaxID=2731099 RepID=UPI00386B5D06
MLRERTIERSKPRRRPPIDSGQRGWTRRELSALVEPSRNEDGNIRYDLFEDGGKPGLFVLIEEWASVDQTRHHEHSAHIRHFHANGDKNVETRTSRMF